MGGDGEGTTWKRVGEDGRVVQLLSYALETWPWIGNHQHQFLVQEVAEAFGLLCINDSSGTWVERPDILSNFYYNFEGGYARPYSDYLVPVPAGWEQVAPACKAVNGDMSNFLNDIGEEHIRYDVEGRHIAPSKLIAVAAQKAQERRGARQVRHGAEQVQAHIPTVITGTEPTDLNMTVTSNAPQRPVRRKPSQDAADCCPAPDNAGPTEIDLSRADWRLERKHLETDADFPGIEEIDIWVRPNGTGKLRVFSAEDLTGAVADFGDIEVTLNAGRPRFWWADLTSEQVDEIRGEGP